MLKNLIDKLPFRIAPNVSRFTFSTVIVVIIGGLLFCSPCFAQITGTASYYSTEACKYNKDPKCPTASGVSLYELEKRGEKFCAMWDVPFGTKLNVCSDSGCVQVYVRDRGPNKRLKRTIDLSKNAFSEIGDLKKGLINVTVEEIK